jgi:hypothetical protein
MKCQAANQFAKIKNKNRMCTKQVDEFMSR